MREVHLEDKYAASDGRVLISGTQSLVRLLLMQRKRDAAAGLDTAGFVSGYRGSPLAGLDRELWRARAALDVARIRFQPAVNEDLAATAIWGTQQVGLFPGARHEGIFALWYGKGPGVDRTGDAFRHANQAGTSPRGGVLVAFGDDHSAESSTLAHQSEQALAAAMIPVLNPASVQELIEFGLYGWALSRYSGLWVGLKCAGETVGTTATIDLNAISSSCALPTDIEPPRGGVHLRAGHAPLESEARLVEHKLPMALAFARANDLDHVLIRGARRRIGIVTTGKALADVRRALLRLGLDDERAAETGIGLYKVALSWPLEPHGLRAFASGFDELLFVEEKRSLLEQQAARLLYDLPAHRRPAIVGKTDERGAPLLPSAGVLDSGSVARAIAARLDRAGLLSDDSRSRFAHHSAASHAASNTVSLTRTPYFCSGCPHNRSTIVPDGSAAMAGIGCSYMALWMDRQTLPSVHMGAEGANWNGIAPFTSTPHIFQNIGDGTYFHSGTLAIRAAVAADVNITYKILYNDAVAMTGGQPVDGCLTVADVARQVLAEGVRKVAIVSDNPAKHADCAHDARVTLHARTELDHVQRRLRDTPGTTVLIYDQVCAAEKRRRRKRGSHPAPARRVFINAAICEGCGDCSARSNCVSVLPLDTPLGRKRHIDQSACNQDFSCLEGFCPSFVTVHDARPRAAQMSAAVAVALRAVPDPAPNVLRQMHNILIAGIGGTGIVTSAALLAMAAHLEGRQATAYDMTGLAQKNGAVYSHVRISNAGTELSGARIDAGQADVVLACDLVAAAAPQAIQAIRRGWTKLLVNSHVAPTGEFQRRGDMDLGADELRRALTREAGDARVTLVDAAAIVTAHLGDIAWSNVFMLGYAFQASLLPVSAAAIERAIEINAVAVDRNRLAFALGRLACHDPQRLQPPERDSSVPRQLDDLIDQGVRLLTAYQNAEYARRYAEFVHEVRACERAQLPHRDELSRAVAVSLAKLMAYKDEYEVARLHVSPDFRRELRREFGDRFTLRYHLAPPLLARRDARTREPRKLEFGPWLHWPLRALAAMKCLRGTVFDVFGHTAERRTERQLPEIYRALVRRLLADLNPARYAVAVTIAELPEQIRGFGHVKTRALARVREEEKRLWSEFYRDADGPAPATATLEQVEA